MSNTAFIGIDPGASGGISMVTPDGLWVASKYPKDREPSMVAALFNKYTNNAHIEGYVCRVYIELVHAMPTDGRSSAFKFGMNYGIWFGVMANNSIRSDNIIKVSPQKWQSIYGDLPKERKLRKNKLKEIAAGIIDNQFKPTLMTSDAILIANYGRMSE